MPHRRFFQRTVLFASAAAVIAGCSPYKAPPPPSRVTVPAQFSSLPATGQAAPDLTEWWTAWQDPLMTQLIRSALAANPEIRTARARIKEARAWNRIARSALYPTVGVESAMSGGGLNWRHPVPPLLQAVRPDIQDPAEDGHIAGMTVSWEPDIFGGKRAGVHAAADMEHAAEEILHGAHMMIAADTASSYLTARGLQDRLALLDHSVATLASLERYARARFTAGQTTRADLDSIHGRLENLRSQKPLMEAQLDTCLHRLAILQGLPPEQAPALPLPWSVHLPALPTGVLPSDVLTRRPDVRMQEDVLLARAEQLTSAKTDLLPRFGLQFFGGDGRLRFDAEISQKGCASG